MTAVLTHPDESTLRDFSLGRLGAAESAIVENHLESCSHCCVVLGKRGESRDTLLDLARQAANTPVSNPSLEAFTAIPPELMDHPRYRIIAPLGEGGMGVVFKAEHRLMGRVVALKVISKRLTSNEQAVERFRREVRAAAMLGHANIVTAYEAEEINGLLFLVMEYVEGISLDRFAAKQKSPVPVSMACHFIRQAALGLQHAHRQGMVHRDIKPQNLMLTRKGQVKILDFGLARLREDREADGLSTPNLVVGTPDYLAPEQARNSHDVDIRADIYALGCTLYYLLAKRVPFPGGSAFEKMIKHTEDTPDSLAKLRPDVPPEVCAIVERMMAKKKEERYQTPVDLANALAPFAKLSSGSATEMMPVPIIEPFALDDCPPANVADTEVMAGDLTQRSRPKVRPVPNKSNRRWLIPVIAASLLVFSGLLIYFATRDSKGNTGNTDDGNKQTAQNPEKQSGTQQLPSTKQVVKVDPKRNPVNPIEFQPRKYKAMIVVPKNGLYYPDFEPVRRFLTDKGVSITVVSLDRGPVQFFGNVPPNTVVQADQSLIARDGFEHWDYSAIICVGANVAQFNPELTKTKDWQKEGKRDPGAYLGEILRKMRDNNRVVASICTGQAVLHWNKIITTERVAETNLDPFNYRLKENYPQAKWEGKQTVVPDGKLITASGPEQAQRFSEEVWKAIQAQ